MSGGELSENLKSLMDEFGRSGLRQLHIREGDFEVYLSNEAGDAPARQVRLRPAAPAASVAAPTQPKPATPAVPTASPADLPANARIVTAPNLGTFYRAPKPGAAPYVELGGAIAAGDELCLIEVMKLFTAVRAEAPGKLHAVLAEDGSMVEAGQPLFAVVDA